MNDNSIDKHLLDILHTQNQLIKELKQMVIDDGEEISRIKEFICKQKKDIDNAFAEIRVLRITIEQGIAPCK